MQTRKRRLKRTAEKTRAIAKRAAPRGSAGAQKIVKRILSILAPFILLLDGLLLLGQVVLHINVLRILHTLPLIDVGYRLAPQPTNASYR
jgi:hypothetical protein